MHHWNELSRSQRSRKSFYTSGESLGWFNSSFLRDCELSSRPPPRQPRRGPGTFIYRSGNRAESTPIRALTTEFYCCTYLCESLSTPSLEPSTLRPLEGTNEAQARRKEAVRAVVTWKTRKTHNDRVGSTVLARYRHPRDSPDPYNTLFYFTVRYLRSFAVFLSLFFSLFFLSVFLSFFGGRV